MHLTTKLSWNSKEASQLIVVAFKSSVHFENLWFEKNGTFGALGKDGVGWFYVDQQGWLVCRIIGTVAAEGLSVRLELVKVDLKPGAFRTLFDLITHLIEATAVVLSPRVVSERVWEHKSQLALIALAIGPDSKKLNFVKGNSDTVRV